MAVIDDILRGIDDPPAQGDTQAALFEFIGFFVLRRVLGRVDGNIPRHNIDTLGTDDIRTGDMGIQPGYRILT